MSLKCPSSATSNGEEAAQNKGGDYSKEIKLLKAIRRARNG